MRVLCGCFMPNSPYFIRRIGGRNIWPRIPSEPFEFSLFFPFVCLPTDQIRLTALDNTLPLFSHSSRRLNGWIARKRLRSSSIFLSLSPPFARHLCSSSLPRKVSSPLFLLLLPFPAEIQFTRLFLGKDSRGGAHACLIVTTGKTIAA